MYLGEEEAWHLYGGVGVHKDLMNKGAFLIEKILGLRS